MQRIPGYEPGGGNSVADEALADISKMFGGYTPNFHKVLANSPATIKGFEALRRHLQGSKLKAAEREIIALEVSRRSNCEYCTAAHSKLLGMHNVDEDQVAAAVSGEPMSNPRYALVQHATKLLYDKQGSSQ